MEINQMNNKHFLYEIWFTLQNCLVISIYETKRYLWSNRTAFLIIFCLIPSLLYISFAGQNASLEIYLHKSGFEWFVGRVLQIYVTFAYIINILVSIVVIQELFLHESALEILLTNTKRFELFTGKTIASLVILIVTSFFSWIGCVLAFLTWEENVPITFGQFTIAFIVLIIISFVPLSVTILGNTLVMKFRSLSGIGSGFTIFIFFVIPFFIFSSVYLGFVTEDMLQFSTYFRIYFITNHIFMTEEEKFVPMSEVENAFLFFTSIIIISIVLAWICFCKMETRKIV